MLAIIQMVLKLFGFVADEFKENKQQATGAALQRGADSEAELQRIVKTNNAKSDAERMSHDEFEKTVAVDPNNRDNQ